MSFAVLFVCTGNICRSPMAERLLLARTSGSCVSASSAGLAGLVDYPMDAPSAAVLREFGGDPNGHLGRRLTPELIGTADLILTATIEHRAAVVQADPLSLRRTFTLREFGRLGAPLGPLPVHAAVEPLRSRVAQVADQRGRVEPAGPAGDDIADPFGAALRVVRATGLQVSDAVDATIRALGLAG